MASKRRVSFVRLDARRHFILFVAFVLFSGTSFVAGVLVGQRNPRPIEEHFDAPFQHAAEAEATLESPDPQRVYTFEDRLTAAEERVERDPVVEPDAPAHTQVPLGHDVEAAAPDEPRVLARDPEPVAPSEAPIGETASDDTEVAHAEAGVGAVDEPGAARVLARTDALDPIVEAPAPAQPRALTRDASDVRAFEVVVASAAGWDAADASRQALRDAGLRATIVTVEAEGERRFDVVLRGEASDAEIARRERLAERVLATPN